ncbi:glycosyltransferase family 4 protein [Microbacterium sp. CH12i]|uniref:glycosyltransferase family 4 protein n=1 Tax=Microbacterium sp. CH12i TaxID=1479651 RepID=UPI0013635819|nr:glycosyltransferase family 4 protein [Microbacterium sp. CH12i]
MSDTERHVHSPRVVFVDHSGLPGGGQLGLARYLTKTRLINVHLILLSPGGAFDVVQKERGFPVEVLNDRDDDKSLLATRSNLKRRLTSLRPDIVIANSNKSALILATLSKRLATRIYYMRDDLNPARKSAIKRIVLGQWMMRRYDVVISNSRWTASTIPVRKIRESARIAYPVSGIPNAQISSGRATHLPLRILSLSRIARWKGIHVLLEAARILEHRGLGDKIILTIAGTSTHEDPEYEKEIWAIAKNLRTSITFTGHVDNPQALLATHDLLVACSTSPEPFGQVVVQGLSEGLIVIASNEGGPVEVITNGVNGFLIPPEDSDRLADLLEKLLLDTLLREQVAGAATLSAARYADAVTVQELDDMIDP